MKEIVSRPRRMFKFINGRRVWFCKKCKKEEARWYNPSKRIILWRRHWNKINITIHDFFDKGTGLLCNQCYLPIMIRDEL